jgi:hypothetical protein
MVADGMIERGVSIRQMARQQPSGSTGTAGTPADALSGSAALRETEVLVRPPAAPREILLWSRPGCQPKISRARPSAAASASSSSVVL